MRLTWLITSLCVCSVTVAETPASRPTSSPSDSSSIQRMIRAMQQQIAELKDENQKLRGELVKAKSELAKLKPPATAAPVGIEVGMSKVDAIAAARAAKVTYESDVTEEIVRGEKVTTEVWRFKLYDPSLGGRVHFKNDVVVKVER